jgi:hypothetical protein
MRARSVPVLAALVLAVAVPGVAQAAPPVEDFRFDESGAGSTDECGFITEFEFTNSGHVMLREVDGQAFPEHTNFQTEIMVTNPETGASIFIREFGLFKDFTAQHVEGNVWEFTAQAVGQYIVEDSDGNVVFRNSGRVATRYLFDTFGDGQPGGEILELEVTGVNGPHPLGPVPDLCTIVTDLIG